MIRLALINSLAGIIQNCRAGSDVGRAWLAIVLTLLLLAFRLLLSSSISTGRSRCQILPKSLPLRWLQSRFLPLFSRAVPLRHRLRHRRRHRWNRLRLRRLRRFQLFAAK